MAPRRASADSVGAGRMLVVDAGLAAGWRRSVPDLDQLDEVSATARSMADEVVIVADASLKWSLPDDQQERFEQYRATATVLCAPGGTRGGHSAFLAAVAKAAADAGREVWVLTGLDLGQGPWRLAMLRRPGQTWEIAFPAA